MDNWAAHHGGRPGLLLGTYAELLGTYPEQSVNVPGAYPERTRTPVGAYPGSTYVRTYRRTFRRKGGRSRWQRATTSAVYSASSRKLGGAKYFGQIH